MTGPLNKLTHKEQPWRCTALISALVRVYFDPERDTKISVDASFVGLAAILWQVDAKTKEGHIGMYASCSLTETEQRYSQTERKAHAVV